ncbi:hypothetical protein M3T53_05495 [Actinomyces sp. B33]|nr:hypothetical protein [Actinomyces sp. B33]
MPLDALDVRKELGGGELDFLVPEARRSFIHVECRLHTAVRVHTRHTRIDAVVDPLNSGLTDEDIDDRRDRIALIPLILEFQLH